MKGTVILIVILFCIACNNDSKQESSNVDSIVNESNITPAPDLGSQRPANGSVKDAATNDAGGGKGNSPDSINGKKMQNDTLKAPHNPADLDTVPGKQ